MHYVCKHIRSSEGSICEKAALHSEHILDSPARESPAHYHGESWVKCVKSQAKAILFSPGFIVLTGGRNSRIIVQIMNREMARCSAVYDTPMKLSKLIRIRIESRVPGLQ
jgi:hypothetical protein